VLKCYASPPALETLQTNPSLLEAGFLHETQCLPDPFPFVRGGVSGLNSHPLSSCVVSFGERE